MWHKSCGLSSLHDVNFELQMMSVHARAVYKSDLHKLNFCLGTLDTKYLFDENLFKSAARSSSVIDSN